jgi:hydroxymethylpyrimidine/phosphomethylpyrimidine kinase
MLSNVGVVRAVANTLRAWRNTPEQRQRQLPIVIDPVCLSTSGHTLLERDAICELFYELLPFATVLTPNLSEAALLLRVFKSREPESISSINGMLSTAFLLLERLGGGSGSGVLLKGGHFPRGSLRLADVASARIFETVPEVRIRGIEYDGMTLCPGSEAEILLRAAAANQRPSSPAPDPVEATADEPVVVDVLCEKEERECVFTLFVRPYLDSVSTHGTGCTLSAALACALARGVPRACPAFSCFSR